MKAYVYCAALYCDACAKEIAQQLECRGIRRSEDSGEWPQGPYSDGGGEADYPVHCDHCGTFLENPLTPDGVTYVRECDLTGLCPLAWKEFYNGNYGLEWR
jgi:hypothetical protein